MDAKAICKLLHYPSLDALQAAKIRGKLPFKLLILEGRRGIFAATDEIAAILIRATSGESVAGDNRESPSTDLEESKESAMK